MITMSLRFSISFLLLGNVCGFSAVVKPSKPPVTTSSTTPEERSAVAKRTWETVGLAPTQNREKKINLSDDSSVKVYDQELFDEFKTLQKGTYFINGLASCKVGNRLIHPFEAHGFVKSLAFDGTGKLHMKTAHVETPLTKRERSWNVLVARGVMSSLASPLLNALAPTERDTANLSATLWPPPGNEKDPVLIVAADNGRPYAVDPATMETVGRLEDKVPVLKGKRFLAHTRIDDARQRLILCCSTFNVDDPKSTSTSIEYMEFDVDWQLISSRTFTTRFMVFHDWMLTDNFYVVPKNPARFVWENLPKMFLGLQAPIETLEMEEETPAELMLIPRHDPTAKVIECEADSFFNIFHFGPCYEEGQTLTVYGSVFDKYQFSGEMGFDGQKQEFDPIAWSSSEAAPPPRLDKFVLDTESGLMLERKRIPLIDPVTGADIAVDMPNFRGDGARCRYSYFVGAARPEGWFPFRSIVKTDLKEGRTHNWDAGDDRVVSEPMFVPRPSAASEDDGYVLSIAHCSTAKACELMVWDSQRFEQGPIAAIDLGELMPWSVHGTWVPDYVA
jgi:all-trans-8'-apo-beta-carotenal 15,15'-oxygenase